MEKPIVTWEDLIKEEKDSLDNEWYNFDSVSKLVQQKLSEKGLLIQHNEKILAHSIKTLDRLITLEAHDHFNKTDKRWASFKESYKSMESKYHEEISLLENAMGKPWSQIKES